MGRDASIPSVEPHLRRLEALYIGSEDDLPISWDDDDTVLRKQGDREYSEELFDSEHGDYGLMKLATKIARLLSALPDNQLTGFR